MAKNKYKKDFQSASPKNDNSPEAVIIEPLQVKIEETGGDYNKLIKKFMKKVRKEETLKPFFGRLMYFSTKSQKKRAKKIESIYRHKQKRKQDLSEDDR